MKRINIYFENMKIVNTSIVFLMLIVSTSQAINTPIIDKEKEPWTEDQLMEPADLAEMINEPGSKLPLILSIGPGGGIKGSIDFGAAQDEENLEEFRKALLKLDKDTALVIYCGCCPFAPCPNIRPAFSLLMEMKFSNSKLLNLSHNLKVDWVDKGFPVE